MRRKARVDLGAGVAQPVCDRACEFGDAHGLVPETAERLLPGDVLQRFPVRRERLLAVLVVEELRVREPRPDHALVALADLGRIRRFDVRDADEMRGQRAVRIEHRHELLVRLHRHDQRLGRHLEEGLIERACDRDRPFGQVRDLVEQRIGQARRQSGRRDARDLAAHARAPLGRIGQHLRVAQRIQPCIGGRDRHRTGMVETVAARFAPRRDAEQPGGDDFLAVQHDQPVHRPHERVFVIAPAHRPWNRQRLECVGEDLRNAFGGPRTGPVRAVHEPRALVGFEFFECGHVDAAALRETGQGARRFTIRVEARGQRRPAPLLHLVRLGRCDARNPRGQAPRRATGSRVCDIRRDAALDEAVADATRECACEFVERLRRQFLGADLDEQGMRRGHHAAAFAFKPGKPSFSRCA